MLTGCNGIVHDVACPLYVEPEEELLKKSESETDGVDAVESDVADGANKVTVQLNQIPKNISNKVQLFLDLVNELDPEDADTIDAAFAAFADLTEEQQEQEDVIAAYTVLMECADSASLLAITENAIYVSKDGSDDHEGSLDSPFATLAKAVDVANTSGLKDITIKLLSDIEANECARITDEANISKNITIDGNGHTIHRMKNFTTIQDNARSTYNPAMIEVTTPNQNGTSLTLKNITLDDCGLHEGAIFSQASDTDKTNNTDMVQDAIVAAYGTDKAVAEIILGENTILKDFGGMSAVRVTGGATLIMEDGSQIYDEIVTDRENRGGNGPAGAIWVQGTKVTMEAGAKIHDVIGRAIYADGTVEDGVNIQGTISNIKADKNMWQKTSGIAMHLRNNADATVSGEISNISGGGFAISLYGGKFTLEESGKLQNLVKTGGILTIGDFQDEITIHGEITGLTGNVNPIQANTVNLLIGETAKIHNNEVSYGALYLQARVNADIYGKIYKNTASQRGGGIGTPGHGHVIINLYNGAEIKDNFSVESGGGLSIKNCTLNMYGGEISGNSTNGPGGGIYIYTNGVQVNLYDGTIKDNNAKDKSNDITIASAEYGTAQRYLYISDKVNIGNSAIYFVTNNKTITLSADSLNTKLGNASSNSVTALTEAAKAKGWEEPAATFWTRRDSAASMTIGGLTTLNSNLPIYVFTQKVTEEGLSVEGADSNVYAGKLVDGNVEITLPIDDMWGNGCAVAIVQPTEDYGSITITGPTEISEKHDDTDYEIPYEATYTVSKNIKSLLTDGSSFKFEMKLDGRLTVDQKSCTLSSPIFEVTSIDVKDNILTVGCKLKEGWQGNLNNDTTATLKFTGILPAADFGDVLETTGSIAIAIPNKINTIVPANICLTKLIPVAEEPLTIKPVDLVKYITMDHLHEDQINCFPDPRYEGIPDDAVITVSGTEWEPSELSGSKYPFTINYYELNSNKLIEDDHKPGTYTAKIEVLPEEGARLDQIKINGRQLQYETGILTVREVVGINQSVDTEEISSQIQDTPPTELQNQAVAVMPDQMTYWVNNIAGCYPTGNDIRLLQDELLSAPDGAEEDIYVQMMIDRLESFDASLENSNRRYAMKYLDLIDAGDSNVLVCAQEPYWIYIPYPEGTDQNTEFRLFHFDGLDRTYTEQDHGPNVSTNIEKSVVREFKIIKTEAGIAFEVHPPQNNRQNYSIGAMALTWKKDSGSSSGGGGGSHSTKHYTLSYDSNGGTEYEDEVYRRNTTVDLDKKPSKEGYTFTGWYADKHLTEKITEIKMTSNKTVYAGWESELGSIGLNTKDHIAYVSGYPDGTVKPSAPVTRAQTAAMLYRLLTDEKRQEIESDINRFIDLKDGDWFYHSVCTMANGNYISGYPDATFKGNNTITRAEFVAMLVRFIGMKDAECTFSDVPDMHWAKDYIATATASGWIAGYGDGTFAPDRNITRAESMAIINRVLDRGINAESELLDYKQFPDNHESAWYFYEVIEATNSHKYIGSRPNEDWTNLD